MSNRHTEITDALRKTLLTLKSIDEYRAFLKDACTINEILDISQNLTVAELLEMFSKASGNEFADDRAILA